MASKVYYHSIKKHGANQQLSKSFYLKNFRCHNGADEVRFSFNTIDILQDLKDYFGSVQINSAYRTSGYNAKIGGAKYSQHVQGRAVDLVVPGVPTATVRGYLDKFWHSAATGSYASFVHLDTRGSASRFYGNQNWYANYNYRKYKRSDYEARKAESIKWIATHRAGLPSAWSSSTIAAYSKGIVVQAEAPAAPQKTEQEILTENQQMLKNYLSLPASKAKIYTLIDNYFSDLAKQEPSSWSSRERAVMEGIGVIKGDENKNFQYKKFLTREEFSTLLYRFYERTTNI